MYISGVLFAMVALVSWAVGDFLIQRVTRHIGTIKALFFIAVAGAIFLFPFAAPSLYQVFDSGNFLLLMLGVCVTFFAAIFDFDALHDGKLAVVEPVLGLELPIVVLLSVTLRHESLSSFQALMIAVIFIGITLAVTARRFRWHHRMVLEKGFVFAGIGAVGMAMTNFLYGVASQESSAMFTVWFIHTIIAIVCLIILMRRRAVHTLARDLKKFPVAISIMAIADNAAWLAFSHASTLVPISIATAISETYIALGVFMGIAINHEKFRRHQYLGAIVAIIGLIALSCVSP